MDALIETVSESATQIQALAVTAGGLVGVFVTLTVFYLLITLANRLGASGSGQDSSSGS